MAVRDRTRAGNHPPARRGRARVVVVGAGFGGAATARALAEQAADVVLVDRHNYHGFWPLLYQVATAALSPDDIAYNVRGIFWRQSNVEVRLAKVTGIDLDGRQVHLDHGGPLRYDYLVVATGSVSNDFGVPGVAEHGYPLKALSDAVALRNHLLELFEAAHTDPTLADGGCADDGGGGRRPHGGRGVGRAGPSSSACWVATSGGSTCGGHGSCWWRWPTTFFPGSPSPRRRRPSEP